MTDGKPRDDDVLLLTHAGKLAKNGAAALGLRAQQHEILVMRVVVLGVAEQLLGHYGDGRQRSAEAMRRGGSEAVERRQFLLAREHELGCCERVGHAPRLL